jgi:hypothetical protein
MQSGAITGETSSPAVKNRLKRMQYLSGLIDGYFASTGWFPPTATGP